MSKNGELLTILYYFIFWSFMQLLEKQYVEIYL